MKKYEMSPIIVLKWSFVCLLVCLKMFCSFLFKQLDYTWLCLGFSLSYSLSLFLLWLSSILFVYNICQTSEEKIGNWGLKEISFRAGGAGKKKEIFFCRLFILQWREQLGQDFSSIFAIDIVWKKVMFLFNTPLQWSLIPELISTVASNSQSAILQRIYEMNLTY